MLTVHIFGKSEGCSKCAALKHKAALVITEEPFRGQFEVEFHDLLTEEGIAEFCRTNINPNCVPGLVVGIGPLFLKSVCSSEEWLERGNLLRPWLGVFTDYGERNRGVIMAKQIREILSLALKQVEE